MTARCRARSRARAGPRQDRDRGEEQGPERSVHQGHRQRHRQRHRKQDLGKGAERNLRKKDTGKVTGKVRSDRRSRRPAKVLFERGAVGQRPGGAAVHRPDADLCPPPDDRCPRRRPVPAQVPYLTVVGGLTDGSKTFRLEQRDHTYLFGRTRRCEFRVNTAEVSREHASFERRAEGVFVNDIGSVNGVMVNNTRVREYRLFDGDLIQIGHVKLRLFDPPSRPGGRTPAHTLPRLDAAPTARRQSPPARDRSESPRRTSSILLLRGRWTRRRTATGARRCGWGSRRPGSVEPLPLRHRDCRRGAARRLRRRRRLSSPAEPVRRGGPCCSSSSMTRRAPPAGAGRRAAWRAARVSASVSASARRAEIVEQRVELAAQGREQRLLRIGARRTSASRIAATLRRRRGSWWRKKSGTAPPSITPRA